MLYGLISGFKILETLAKVAADQPEGTDLPLDQPLPELSEQIHTFGDGSASASEMPKGPIKNKMSARTESADATKRFINIALVTARTFPKIIN